eukprot:TRINITY_DN35698_c0_g1_i3.p1 TRINITY_DN35698_c0_g1~~TRINITY_DN35698_c0_g1_i3.p1  ORF type:complete len:1384 (-),score=291.89 TRINITY_DN35698_c0_g1_i3:51-4202(-)
MVAVGITPLGDQLAAMQRTLSFLTSRVSRLESTVEQVAEECKENARLVTRQAPFESMMSCRSEAPSCRSEVLSAPPSLMVASRGSMGYAHTAPAPLWSAPPGKRPSLQAIAGHLGNPSSSDLGELSCCGASMQGDSCCPSVIEEQIHPTALGPQRTEDPARSAATPRSSLPLGCSAASSAAALALSPIEFSPGTTSLQSTTKPALPEDESPSAASSSSPARRRGRSETETGGAASPAATRKASPRNSSPRNSLQQAAQQEKGNDGMTSLHWAAVKNLRSFCTSLLDGNGNSNEKGIEPNGRDSCQWTALHHAAANGSLDVCRALLDHGSFTVAGATADEGQTALHIAVENDFQEVARLLLEHPSFSEAVNVVDHLGRTALHVAAVNGHTALMRFILNAPAFTSLRRKDNQGRTALVLAVMDGQEEAFQTIVDHDTFSLKMAAGCSDDLAEAAQLARGPLVDLVKRAQAQAQGVASTPPGSTNTKDPPPRQQEQTSSPRSTGNGQRSDHNDRRLSTASSRTSLDGSRFAKALAKRAGDRSRSTTPEPSRSAPRGVASSGGAKDIDAVGDADQLPRAAALPTQAAGSLATVGVATASEPQHHAVDGATPAALRATLAAAMGGAPEEAAPPPRHEASAVLLPGPFLGAAKKREKSPSASSTTSSICRPAPSSVLSTEAASSSSAGSVSGVGSAGADHISRSGPSTPRSSMAASGSSSQTAQTKSGGSLVGALLGPATPRASQEEDDGGRLQNEAKDASSEATDSPLSNCATIADVSAAACAPGAAAQTEATSSAPESAVTSAGKGAEPSNDPPKDGVTAAAALSATEVGPKATTTSSSPSPSAVPSAATGSSAAASSSAPFAAACQEAARTALPSYCQPTAASRSRVLSTVMGGDLADRRRKETAGSEGLYPPRHLIQETPDFRRDVFMQPTDSLLLPPASEYDEASHSQSVTDFAATSVGALHSGLFLHEEASVDVDMVLPDSRGLEESWEAPVPSVSQSPMILPSKAAASGAGSKSARAQMPAALPLQQEQEVCVELGGAEDARLNETAGLSSGSGAVASSASRSASHSEKRRAASGSPPDIVKADRLAGGGGARRHSLTVSPQGEVEQKLRRSASQSRRGSLGGQRYRDSAWPLSNLVFDAPAESPAQAGAVEDADAPVLFGKDGGDDAVFARARLGSMTLQSNLGGITFQSPLAGQHASVPSDALPMQGMAEPLHATAPGSSDGAVMSGLEVPATASSQSAVRERARSAGRPSARGGSRAQSKGISSRARGSSSSAAAAEAAATPARTASAASGALASIAAAARAGALVVPGKEVSSIQPSEASARAGRKNSLLAWQASRAPAAAMAVEESRPVRRSPSEERQAVARSRSSTVGGGRRHTQA